MEKFNIGTLKFVVMIVAICLLFFLLVNNAYNYLPKEDTMDDIPYNDSYSQETVSYSSSKKESSNNNEEKNTDNTESKQVTDEFDEERNDSSKKQEFNNEVDKIAKIKKDSESIRDLRIPDEKLEEISESDLNSQNSNSAENLLNRANELKQGNKYEEAISVFEQLISITSNTQEIANYQENIAILYAKMKRYGSALSYAQQSYNNNPSTEREVLLARIYYKVGDINRAQARMNNVLKREF